MKKTNITQLKQAWREATVVEPNELGHPLLTKVYRTWNGYFKTAPFIFVIPGSILAFCILAVLFRIIVIRLASVLQYGF